MTSPLVSQFASQTSSQFLFYSHAQVLMYEVHKPKQTWSIESFSALAIFKQWPSTQEHVFKFHSLNAEQRTCKANAASENSSLTSTVRVKSVPRYHFKLAYAVLQMAVKEFFETHL